MELKNVEIIKIGELKKFPIIDFYCVEFVVKTEDQYPQLLQLQANKDKADAIIKYNKVGDKVDCSINLRGREWTNKEGVVKYFNTIECWKCFKADGKDSIPAPAFEPVADLNTAEQSDLPF
jgi:hypothetical protein